jgi:hypothetical protein
MNFQLLLQKIQTAGQIALAADETLTQGSSDHVTATQEVLQVAGASVAAESSDPVVQQEAVEATQLASTLTPLFFGLVGNLKAFLATWKKPAAATKTS